MDRTPVTNRQFKEFVKATGHVTYAEIAPNPKDYPGALPQMLYAGSLVFSPPARVANLQDWSQWWTYLKGADWRRPYGPKSNINALGSHPVVHVSFADALAYAKWAGKDLPGQSFYEGPDDVHLVDRNASSTNPAKFVVFLIKNKGAPALLPAD
jgi:formylglycine-generating enzyme